MTQHAPGRPLPGKLEPLEEDTAAAVPPLIECLRRGDPRRPGSLPTQQWVARWVRAGADVDQPDAAGRTPLMLAAAAGELQLTGYLLGRGARVNVTCARGYTALAYAACAGRGAVAAFLKSRGANPNAVAPLYDAVRRNDLRRVACLLRTGVSMRLRDRHGNTPLGLACACGHEAIVRAFLRAGADPHQANRRGISPLRRARRARNWPLVAMLEGRRPEGPWARLRRRLRHRLRRLLGRRGLRRGEPSGAAGEPQAPWRSSGL